MALATFYTKERAVWVLPVFHFDAIFAGLLLGAGVGTNLRTRVPGDLLVLAASSIFLGMLLMPGDNTFAVFLPDGNPLVFTLLALAFFLAVLGTLDKNSWTARALALPPLVFLGRISYGLYVWHLVGIGFGPALSPSWLTALQRSGELTWWITVSRAFVLTVVLAVLSFFTIERPFLRVKRRFTVVPNRVD